jgi:hypothetical protein
VCHAKQRGRVVGFGLEKDRLKDLGVDGKIILT